MLLVVMTHISGFALGTESENGFHGYFQQFRMPLFFFVSGFVFYKENFKWNVGNTLTFIKKKVTVQIISPLIFLLCYIYIKEISLKDALVSPTKSGYWFTFTLFSYFILYILWQKIFDFFRLKGKWRLIILLCIGFSLFNNFPINIPFRMGYAETLNILGLTQLKYFIFFVCGVCVKKYFRQFEKILDTTQFTAITIATYFLTNIFVGTANYNHHINNSIFLLLELCGIVIVFSIFRKNQAVFASENKVSKLLKFIGKRTLDIYLLHYFFIPFGLHKIFPFFTENNFPIIEFAVCLILTIMIVVACLVVSAVFRTSNTLGHFLFGAKKMK